MFLLDFALAFVLGMFSLIPTSEQFVNGQASLDAHTVAAEVLEIRNNVQAAYGTRSSYAGLTTASSQTLGLVGASGPGSTTLQLSPDTDNPRLMVIDLEGIAQNAACVALVTENAWAWQSITVNNTPLLGADIRDVVRECDGVSRVVLRSL